nr:DUF3575 domain-containing protein [Bacteroides acidifaciens]
MKNKQNVAGSTFRCFVLAFLLSLSVVPMRGQPDAAVLPPPPADSLIIFRYPSRVRMFKTEYADNRLSLRKLKKQLRTFRKRQDTLYVQSYSGSWDDEKANLRAAYWRANNLKGYLIDHYGLRERHFRTVNHPLAHPLWGEVVVVGCQDFQSTQGSQGTQGSQDSQSETLKNRQEPVSTAERQEQQETFPVALQGDKEPVDSSAVAATAVAPDASIPSVTPDASTAPSTSVFPSSSAATPFTSTSPSLPANGRYLGVKTNLAAWTGTIMNIAADVQVGKHLSVELPILWCPWHISGKHAVKTFTLQPEARYWLSKPGSGHFFGLHAHVGWFNVKWDRDRYQDADRPLLGTGVSYGYLLPLGGHWAGEFTLGAGYANMRYDTYYNIDNGARIDTRTKNYWGITRVGLSIVYRFNLKK